MGIMENKSLLYIKTKQIQSTYNVFNNFIGRKLQETFFFNQVNYLYPDETSTSSFINLSHSPSTDKMSKLFYAINHLKS